ncbi:hypothetical protein KP509_29G079800 [Ceratopteris richardii]|uniref:RING-type E3 ubiquitin transferase n=1 Tax=Ceratopteris richardii TaxID=49495 RepID=A0A8T2RAF8_CERRI|nr:hypothetical protein KP509_29G079800 [Ceratopteris richardii]
MNDGIQLAKRKSRVERWPSEMAPCFVENRGRQPLGSFSFLGRSLGPQDLHICSRLYMSEIKAPILSRDTNMSISISGGRRGLHLLQSLSPAAPPLPQPGNTSLPLTSLHPYLVPYNGHYMVLVVAAIVVTFIFVAVISFRSAILSGRRAQGAGVASPPPSAHGLDRDAIDKLPVAVFHCSEDVDVRLFGVEGCESIVEGPSQATTSKEYAGSVEHHDRKWTCRAECAICLADFQESECIRILPKCEHYFHERCIESWLIIHSTCPLCRSNLLLVPAKADPSAEPPIGH